MIVHVVAFHPRENGTGGFHWFPDRPGAGAFLSELVETTTDDLIIRQLDVPDGMTDQAVTDLIDENPDAWGFGGLDQLGARFNHG